MKCHVVKLIIDGRCFFALYYSSDRDGFICKNSRIITFEDEAAAAAYANANGIQPICSGDTIKDITNINDCAALVDLWNVAADAADSTGLLFMGDDEQYNDIYAKLVSGCNLSALEHEHYQPNWTAHETGMLREIADDAVKVLKTAVSAHPLRIYAIAALESGYISTDKLRELAFTKIERTPKPEEWVIDIAASVNKEEMLNTLSAAWYNDVYSRSEYHQAIMGYYYLQYKEGRSLLSDFLRKCGDYADGDGYDIIDYGKFYYPLNDLEEKPSLADDDGFIQQFDSLCGDWGRLAQAQYKTLTDYMEIWQ